MHEKSKRRTMQTTSAFIFIHHRSTINHPCADPWLDEVRAMA
jgi:hypothetical protein